jgi:hypothetical protein
MEYVIRIRILKQKDFTTLFFGSSSIVARFPPFKALGSRIKYSTSTFKSNVRLTSHLPQQVPPIMQGVDKI